MKDIRESSYITNLSKCRLWLLTKDAAADRIEKLFQCWRKHKLDVSEYQILTFLKVFLLSCLWCFRFCSQILRDDDKSVHRSAVIKNAKRNNRFGHEQQLDRGDFDIFTSAAGPTECPCHQQVNWCPCQHYCTRSRVKRYKTRPPVYFKRGTARLRCTDGTFRVHKIYGDGNCMFRAISYILWRNEDEHRNLRTLVVQHIKDNWHEYGPFVMAEWNISDRQSYGNYMNMVGTFACELECTVATKMYYMNLSIYREINDRHELKRVFHNHVSSQYETARLLFTGNSDSGHYDVLFPDG